jgi:hypothetical protein
MKATQQPKGEHEDVKIILSILEQVYQQFGGKGKSKQRTLEGYP